MEPAWDYITLRAWFSTRSGEDVAETDLLREYFPDAEGELSLALFQRHFLLYRRLWLFDDELRRTTGERLWIRGIRSTLLPPPLEGRCGWLDPNTGLYCEAEHCPLHTENLPEWGMKSYYMDWKNLEGMTEEGLQSLVSGFFRWMGVRGDVGLALETLGLSADADARTIKARWRKLSKDHHPDRGGDPDLFQRLSAAWAVLKSLK